MNRRRPSVAGPTRRSCDYEAFGLGFRSDLLIPEFRRAAIKPAVNIRIAQLERSGPLKGEGGEWSRVDDGVVYLGWDGVGTFRVSGGDGIAVDPDPDVSHERLRLFLLGAAIGALLHQRGYFVLHASAVAIGGTAVAFLGPKWGGKSTTAAILHYRGHELITDDVLAVDMSGSIPLAQPGFPQLKLWPDSLSGIGENGTHIPRLHPGLEKRDYRVAARFAERATPLGAVYVLDDAAEPGIEALGPGPALSELIGNWYCGRFGYETLEAMGISSHFVWSTKLLNDIPFYRLGRPRSLAAIQQLADIVEGSRMAGLTPAPPSNFREG